MCAGCGNSNTEDERVATPVQIRRRGRLGLLMGGTAFAAFAFAAVASADDIGNKLDSQSMRRPRVMPLNAGGAAGTTQLFVTPTGSDGKPGLQPHG